MEERGHRAMSIKRQAAEGVLNIVRFNWPFFAWSAVGVAVLLLIALCTHSWVALAGLILLLVGGMIPLLVSFYVYDLSGLYEMSFLAGPSPRKVVNLTAGFDETTATLQAKFPEAEVLTFDFYQKDAHTEPSIRRARNRLPSPTGTLSISTSEIPLPDGEADLILGFLSVHEVRDANERLRFLTETKRALAPHGSLIIVEHLRDLPNFLAYSIGFLHFHSRRTWLQAFAGAGLTISQEECLTPFIRVFKLTRP
jgi:SAM-dependent methyltransferase